MRTKKPLVGIMDLFLRMLKFGSAFPPHPNPLPRGEGTAVERDENPDAHLAITAVECFSLSLGERVGVRGNAAFTLRLGFAVTLLLSTHAFAQPKFTSVSPNWVQRGATL